MVNTVFSKISGVPMLAESMIITTCVVVLEVFMEWNSWNGIVVTNSKRKNDTLKRVLLYKKNTFMGDNSVKIVFIPF